MSQDAEGLGLSCCICLDCAADGSRWVALSACGHMMHAGCLDMLTASKATEGKAPICPFCRVRLQQNHRPLPPYSTPDCLTADCYTFLAAFRSTSSSSGCATPPLVLGCRSLSSYRAASQAGIAIKPSKQTGKALTCNVPIACRPELRRLGGGSQQHCSLRSDGDAVNGLTEQLRERNVQARSVRDRCHHAREQG